ncbi:MAG: hypothetical protein OXM03_12585 [Chloroflexota bacterium]|nr:hypothetical protein [Chloroflexota bacterium]MDE2841456.1 hypothetical protein [Chloroflexota bacterium]
MLEDHGYEFIWPAGLVFAMRDMGQPVYTKQVDVGRNIYGKERRVDFLLFHPTRHPNGLVIQCKWQASGGSVDEKYPFEVLCINAGEFDTIIVLDGGGYSVGAEQWLRSQAGRNRLKHVFNQGEFQRFTSRGNL